MIETIKRLIGYRKYGAFDRPDEIGRGVSIVKKEQIESHYHISGLPVGMISTETKDQGRTNRCTAYALSKVVEIMATRRLKKMIFIDPNELWKHQLESGATEKGGDSLQNAVRQLVKYGASFNDYDPSTGKKCIRRITFDGFSRIMPKDFDKWLEDGHPIFTGVTVYDDFVVNDIIDFDGKKMGGHAIPIVGGGTARYRIENSWNDKWGIDGTCLLNKEDSSRCMSSYVLIGMNIV